VSAVAASAPRHRRITITRRQLRDSITHLKGLLREARDDAAGQQRQAARREAGAERLIADQQAVIDQLKADAVDVSVLRQQLERSENARAILGRDLIATQAALSNAHKVTVPPMHRDTDGLDQATVPTPIPVMTLPEAFGVRP
jgi:hypothetical protein